eukprot:Clim_evm84s201 gene=Clim_evmTU84s201
MPGGGRRRKGPRRGQTQRSKGGIAVSEHEQNNVVGGDGTLLEFTDGTVTAISNQDIVRVLSNRLEKTLTIGSDFNGLYDAVANEEFEKVYDAFRLAVAQSQIGAILKILRKAARRSPDPIKAALTLVQREARYGDRSGYHNYGEQILKAFLPWWFHSYGAASRDDEVIPGNESPELAEGEELSKIYGAGDRPNNSDAQTAWECITSGPSRLGARDIVLISRTFDFVHNLDDDQLIAVYNQLASRGNCWKETSQFADETEILTLIDVQRMFRAAIGDNQMSIVVNIAERHPVVRKDILKAMDSWCESLYFKSGSGGAEGSNGIVDSDSLTSSLSESSASNGGSGSSSKKKDMPQSVRQGKMSKDRFLQQVSSQATRQCAKWGLVADEVCPSARLVVDSNALFWHVRQIATTRHKAMKSRGSDGERDRCALHETLSWEELIIDGIKLRPELKRELAWMLHVSKDPVTLHRLIEQKILKPYEDIPKRFLGGSDPEFWSEDERAYTKCICPSIYEKQKDPHQSSYWKSRKMKLSDLRFPARITMVDSRESLKDHSFLSDIGTRVTMGIDMEWKPNMFQGQKQPVALVQIAYVVNDRTEVVFLDVPSLDPKFVHKIMADILSSPDTVKVGFGLANDLNMLEKTLAEHDLSLPGITNYFELEDVNRMIKEMRDVNELQQKKTGKPRHGHRHNNHRSNLEDPSTHTTYTGSFWLHENPYKGLSGLVYHFFGYGLDKTEQMSEWERRPLRTEQKIYAALDAAVLVDIFSIFKENLAPDANDVSKATLLHTGFAKAKLSENELLDPNLCDVLQSQINKAFLNKAFKIVQEPRQQAVSAGTKKSHKKATTSAVAKEGDGQHPAPSQSTKNTSGLGMGVPPTNPSDPPIFPPDCRFAVDNMICRLGRHLRLCGIDTLLNTGGTMTDQAFITRINSEDRTLLTRGQRFHVLLNQLDYQKAVQVQGDSVEDQLAWVLKYFNIKVRPQDMFSRCQRCNDAAFHTFTAAEMSARAEANPEVYQRFPPGLFDRELAFHECTACHKVYWDGAHARNFVRDFGDVIEGSTP